MCISLENAKDNKMEINTNALGQYSSDYAQVKYDNFCNVANCCCCRRYCPCCGQRVGYQPYWSINPMCGGTTATYNVGGGLTQ